MKARSVGNLAFALALAAATPALARDAEAEAAAMKVLDAFMVAFNAGDAAAFETVLHFPHYRIASGKVSALQDPSRLPALFERFVAAIPSFAP